MRYQSGGYSKLTFKPEDIVEIDNSEFVECRFLGCELIGDGLNWRTSRCEYTGRALERVAVLMRTGRQAVEILT